GGWCVRHASCPQRRACGYRHGAPSHNLYPVSGFSQLIRWSGRFAQTAQLWLFTAQFGLLLADPLEGALVELGDGAWAFTFGIHRCADNHLNGARAFAPAGFRPELAGIVGDGQNRQAGIYRQSRATARELADLPWGNARAFGEHQHPGALLEAFVALLGQLLERRLGVAAVDGDGLEQRHAPAEERHVQQFALDHLAERFEIGGEEEGFPGALVVGEDHAGALGDVLHAAHFIADADDYPGQPNGAAAPG